MEKDKIAVFLRQEREKRGIKIEEIVENTRIPIKYIKMIEDGEWEKFRSPVFLTGYLKIYCEYLNLKKEIIDKILFEFKKENKKEEEEEIKENKKNNEKEKNEKILLIILPLIFFTIYFLTLHILSNVSSNL